MIKLPTKSIVDTGKVRLGTGNGHDLRPQIKLPSTKIQDAGKVKLGTGNGHDLRPVRKSA